MSTGAALSRVSGSLYSLSQSSSVYLATYLLFHFFLSEHKLHAFPLVQRTLRDDDGGTVLGDSVNTASDDRVLSILAASDWTKVMSRVQLKVPLV